MPQGRCANCNRLIYDTEKVEDLHDVIECQHCHHPNVIQRDEPMPIPTPRAPQPTPRSRRGR